MSDPSPNHDYWDAFYAERAASLVPDQPSAFAGWALERMGPNQTLVEFGFGTARDSLWFALHGHRVRGFDFAESAVTGARASASKTGVDAGFDVIDLYDRATMKHLMFELRGLSSPPVIYGRFLLHSLTDEGRHNLFDLMAGLEPVGCTFFFEFRTGQDAEAMHLFGDDHFRQFLDPDVVTREIVERGGAVDISVVGTGLATYKTEDPHVARIFGRWAPDGRPAGCSARSM